MTEIFFVEQCLLRVHVSNTAEKSLKIEHLNQKQNDIAENNLKKS